VNDSELTSAVKQILDQQEKISTSLLILQKPKPEKDLWDKFASMSTFVSGVLVASIGLYFTTSYNKQQATLNAQQEIRDTALKNQQTSISQIQSVAPFTQFLMGKDDVNKQRHHALRILTLLPDQDLARALTTEFPDELTVDVVKSFQDDRHPGIGNNIAAVKSLGAASGHTVLFDGFKNYMISGFHFSTKKLVPWGTTQLDMQPDIEVANPGNQASNAVFFLERDTPPYETTKDFSGGKIPASGGIIKMPQKDLDAIKSAPTSGYISHYFSPEIGGTYCIQTWDGLHYAKIKVTEMTSDRIGFDWVYQPSGSPTFE